MTKHSFTSLVILWVRPLARLPATTSLPRRAQEDSRECPPSPSSQSSLLPSACALRMAMREVYQSGCFPCFSTGMFALPSYTSHVTSAAFAQARLRLGSASAQVCSPAVAQLRLLSLEFINFWPGAERVTPGIPGLWPLHVRSHFGR